MHFYWWVCLLNKIGVDNSKYTSMSITYKNNLENRMKLCTCQQLWTESLCLPTHLCNFIC